MDDPNHVADEALRPVHAAHADLVMAETMEARIKALRLLHTAVEDAEDILMELRLADIPRISGR